MSLRALTPHSRLCPLTATTIRLGTLRGLKTGRVALLNHTSPTRSEAATKNAEGVIVQPSSRIHGSMHWNIERALSIALIPLTFYPMIYGSQPIVDYSLGIILPAHCHFGFQAIITDYLPHRKTPIFNIASSWALRAATALTLYGCYELNSNGDGISETIKKLWKA
ncbi:membrane anchor subunit of succinate dehydrogenase, Sdh4 [Basidiobolus ranarum]|uniref:Succinate dehydrogenase [ubiquinone] cytochrome b small subunit n=1 Tax=Basidiobolus ranarum TaxID=34480 RepID=A0ABR2WEW5_9FUNG